APQPRLTWYRFKPRIGLEKQSYSISITLLASEDSVRHYQTEALLGLYTPIAERRGVAPDQDQTCPRGVTSHQVTPHEIHNFRLKYLLVVFLPSLSACHDAADISTRFFESIDELSSISEVSAAYKLDERLRKKQLKGFLPKMMGFSFKKRKKDTNVL
ncbi:hypothetical protein EVAR_70106_1, partial [Eumeta japonica]